MRMGDAFPGAFLTAGDLANKGVKEIKVQVRSVINEEVGGEMKPIMYFVGKDKGLVMNKTNWMKMTEGCGTDESNEWTGQEVMLYHTTTEFHGKVVPCLRVRIDAATPAPPKAKKAKPKPPTMEQQFEADGNPAGDDIPF